jgi:hypothetical protein
MIPEQVTKVAYEQVESVVNELAKYALNGESVKMNFETGSVTIEF